MVKSAKNPGGTPIEVFDEFRTQRVFDELGEASGIVFGSEFARARGCVQLQQQYAVQFETRAMP